MAINYNKIVEGWIADRLDLLIEKLEWNRESDDVIKLISLNAAISGQKLSDKKLEKLGIVYEGSEIKPLSGYTLYIQDSIPLVRDIIYKDIIAIKKGKKTIEEINTPNPYLREYIENKINSLEDIRLSEITPKKYIPVKDVMSIIGKYWKNNIDNDIKKDYKQKAENRNIELFGEEYKETFEKYKENRKDLKNTFQDLVVANKSRGNSRSGSRSSSRRTSYGSNTPTRRSSVQSQQEFALNIIKALNTDKSISKRKQPIIEEISESETYNEPKKTYTVKKDIKILQKDDLPGPTPNPLDIEDTVHEVKDTTLVRKNGKGSSKSISHNKTKDNFSNNDIASIMAKVKAKRQLNKR